MAMTDAEKLNKLMTMLDDDVSTNVANTFLEAAEKAVINLAFPFGDGTEVMPEKYEEVQIEIAAYLINKRGAEGEVTHTEGGVTRTYESADLPLALRTRITPKAGGF
jgi:hypothetical protein